MSGPAFASWHDAEAALGDALEWLGAVGDREGAFLAAGRSSSWPRVLRIEQSDYPDRPDPRLRLSRAQLEHVDAMLLSGGALFLAIPEAHRSLVGRVLLMKRFPQSSAGFRWRYVREALLRAGDGGGGGDDGRVPAPEALRKRYERAVGEVARAMTRLGFGCGYAQGAAA